MKKQVYFSYTLALAVFALAALSVESRASAETLVYFWKVAAEDENGTVIESETRRFEVQ
jgi:hypothetical protein